MAFALADFLKSAVFWGFNRKNLYEDRPGWTISIRAIVEYLAFQIDVRCHYIAVLLNCTIAGRTIGKIAMFT